MPFDAVPPLLVVNVPGAPPALPNQTAGVVDQQMHLYVDSDQKACLDSGPNGATGTVFVQGYYVAQP
jgi:hypothetical protein